MDALAGYGSDDTSSSEAHLPARTNNLFDLLGSAAADDSEEESHGGTGMDTVPCTPQSTPPAQTVQSESPQALKTFVPLPAPILSTGDNDSTIYWTIDYLKQPVKKGGTLLSLDEPVPTEDEWNAKLQHLASNLSSNNNHWADHLRAQHEFHNPHFFASVVDHFGLKESLGSMVDSGHHVEAYERQLFPVSSCEQETITKTTP